MSSSLILSRHRTALRVAGCVVPGMVGVTITIGCLLALFLANLGFFGVRPEVPLGHTLSLPAGAAAGIGVPALVAVIVLDGRRQRLVVAVVMLAVLLLGSSRRSW